MSSLHLIEIYSTESKTQIESVLDKDKGSQAFIQSLINYLSGVVGGTYRALIGAALGAVQAHGHLTVASTGSGAGEACTICNVTFTARASGASGNEFNVSATPTTQAANMAAAINASTDLTGIVTATSNLGVVTITASVPGLYGNGLELSAGNLANTTATAFSGGANGDEVTADER